MKTPAELTGHSRRPPARPKHFAAFSPSHRREYIEWVLEAKRPQTRATRIAKTVAQVAGGKSLKLEVRALTHG